jgi:predicted HTH domain antitoxin
MQAKSIRISDDMLTAIGFVGRREHIEASAAVRKLIRVGLETYTVKLYQQGFLSLRETAKRLSLDLVETTELMLDYGVKGNLTASDVLQSIDHFC